MMWLTWRQHRSEVLIVGGLGVGFALLVLLSGHTMAVTYQQLGIGACHSREPADDCSALVQAFQQQWQVWDNFLPWFNLAPMFLAMLVGAPLVARELEHRTHQLVWTQSITRLRWVAVKLASVVGASLLVWAVVTALLTWWRSPFDQLDGRLAPGPSTSRDWSRLPTWRMRWRWPSRPAPWYDAPSRPWP